MKTENKLKPERIRENKIHLDVTAFGEISLEQCPIAEAWKS